MLRETVRAAKAVRPTVAGRWQRARRKAFVAAVRAAAEWHDATVDLEVASDLVIGSGVRVTFLPGSHNVLRIGPYSRLGDRVLIMLKGGEVLLGPETDLRRDVILNVSGRLELVGLNGVSWGSTLHCGRSVRLEHMAGCAERVTISDSAHFFTEKGEYFYHNAKFGEVVVGSNTWLCPNAVLTSRAQVGDHCIVAAGSVVIGEVPPGHLASGVPATVSSLRLPWLEAEQG